MLLQANKGVVSRAEESEFKVSGHREADTMMVYYACRMSVTKKVIVVRADDSDVFILLLHHQLHMSSNTTILMDMGLSSKNNRRCHNMSEIAASLGPKVRLTSSFNLFLCTVYIVWTYLFMSVYDTHNINIVSGFRYVLLSRLSMRSLDVITLPPFPGTRLYHSFLLKPKLLTS